MKRYFIKMTAAILSGMLLTGCGPTPVFANSGEDPNPEEIITSFEELELIKPTADDDEEEDSPVAEARIVDDINAEDDEYEDNSLTALTPEGNMTLVDDITTKGGKQFLTMTSKSGNYFYIVIDRANSGENNVYFLNQVDERDLLSGMNEEDRTFLEEEAKKKAEEEAALEAAEKAKQEEEAAAAAAAESAAAQAESEAAAAAERETRSPAGIKIGNFTLTPKMEAILACAGILVAVLVIVLIVFRKSKPAEQEADPDDYDDYDDELDEEPEQEDNAFDEEEE